MANKTLNPAPKQVIITAAHIKAALRVANVEGVNFADDKHLPTTFTKARHAEMVLGSKAEGLFIGLTAAHLVRVGAGTYTGSEFSDKLMYGKSSVEMRAMKGGGAVYTRLTRYRRSIYALIGKTGRLVNDSEALRVTNATGEVRPEAPKEERPPRTPGTGKKITKGGGKAGKASNIPAPCKADGSACTIITLGNVKRAINAETRAAFISTACTQFMVTLESEDADVREAAKQNINGLFTRLLADICAE